MHTVNAVTALTTGKTQAVGTLAHTSIMCMYVRTYVHTYIRMYVYTYTYVYTIAHMHTNTNIHTYICYICMYISAGVPGCSRRYHWYLLCIDVHKDDFWCITCAFYCIHIRIRYGCVQNNKCCRCVCRKGIEEIFRISRVSAVIIISAKHSNKHGICCIRTFTAIASYLGQCTYCIHVPHALFYWMCRPWWLVLKSLAYLLHTSFFLVGFRHSWQHRVSQKC